MPYHVNAAGEPGQCRAQKGNCPFSAEDTHFADAREARATYEKAMDFLASKRPVYYADNENLDEVKKIAQVLALENRHVVVSHMTETYADESTFPESDDFEDEDEYEEAVAEWEDSYRDEEVPFLDPTHSYEIHTFESWSAVQASDERGWGRGWHRFGFGDSNEDVERGEELETPEDFETPNYRKVEIAGYYYPPVTNESSSTE